MIYFDNSATTNIKPKEVYKTFNDALINYCANPGRSGHSLSLKASQKVFETRNTLSNFFNVDSPQRVIFTQNCTDALNLGILGTVIKGGHIICSCNDHNSLARPLFELQKRNLIEVSVAYPKNGFMLTAEDIEPLIKQNTYMVAINHVSNVNGDCADIKSIGELCAKKCLLFLLDVAQSAGHEKIDMQKHHIDMLAVAPHKGLYSPQGIGVFAFSLKTNVNPIRFGGTGTSSLELYQTNEYPESLESGTIATPNILAMQSGIKFVNQNFDRISKKIDDLATYMLFELDKINNIKTYTHVENIKNGVIGFNIAEEDSSVIANILSENYNVCVRGGFHCAGLKHNHLNTLKQGVVRASLSYFNSFTECENFIKIIKRIANRY